MLQSLPLEFYKLQWHHCLQSGGCTFAYRTVIACHNYNSLQSTWNVQGFGASNSNLHDALLNQLKYLTIYSSSTSYVQFLVVANFRMDSNNKVANNAKKKATEVALFKIVEVRMTHLPPSFHQSHVHPMDSLHDHVPCTNYLEFHALRWHMYWTLLVRVTRDVRQFLSIQLSPLTLLHYLTLPKKNQ